MPPTKIDCFPKLIFDLHQTSQARLTQQLWFKVFLPTQLYIFFVKFSEIHLKLKKCQKTKTWRSLGRFLSYHLLLQTILSKIIWEKLKTHIKLNNTEKLWYLFLQFFLALIKNLFWQGRMNTRPCPHAPLTFS